MRNRIGIVPSFENGTKIANAKAPVILAFYAKRFIAKKNGDSLYVLEYEEIDSGK